MSTKAVESKTKLKINHLRSSPEPPELAGFYVDSVCEPWSRGPGAVHRQIGEKLARHRRDSG